MNAMEAVDGMRSQGRARVVTFLGYSGAGYEAADQVRKTLQSELENLDPADTLVCSGATAEGIGMVYELAVQMGFRTAGIVSSVAHTEGVKFAAQCERLFVVDDAMWGGKQANEQLSPTSQAMVDASDVMIGIGGGAITRDELEEGRKCGKTVRFYQADMNHAQAQLTAARAGRPAPRDFGGAAQALFQK